MCPFIKVGVNMRPLLKDLPHHLVSNSPAYIKMMIKSLNGLQEKVEMVENEFEEKTEELEQLQPNEESNNFMAGKKPLVIAGNVDKFLRLCAEAASHVEVHLFVGSQKLTL